jgi:hypothetical protein
MFAQSPAAVGAVMPGPDRPIPYRPIPYNPARRSVVIGLLGATASAPAARATPVTRGDDMMPWDYLLVEETMAADDLARVGAEGWELVAVVSPAHFVFHYFFKRPRRG